MRRSPCALAILSVALRSAVALAGICERIDPATSIERPWVSNEDDLVVASLDPEVDPIVHRYANSMDPERSQAGEQLRRHAAAMYSKLCDPDPKIRFAALYVLAGANEPASVPHVLELLHRERHVRIVSKALQVLGGMKAPELVPIVAELMSCHVSELRRLALTYASAVSDPSLVEPLLDAWSKGGEDGDKYAILQALGKTGDHRGVDVGLEALEQGVWGLGLLRAVARKEDLPRFTATMQASYDRWPGQVRRDAALFARELGGSEALALLRWALEREQAEDTREALATEILLVQMPVAALDRGLQVTPVPVDLDAILAPGNAPCFALASRHGTRLDQVLGAIQRSTLAEAPRRQADVWRKLLNMLDASSIFRIQILTWLADALGDKGTQDYPAAIEALEQTKELARDKKGWESVVQSASTKIDELRRAAQRRRGEDAIGLAILSVGPGGVASIRITNRTSSDLSLPGLEGGSLVALLDWLVGDETVTLPMTATEGGLRATTVIRPGASIDVVLKPETVRARPDAATGGARVQLRLLGYPSSDASSGWVGAAISPPVEAP